MNHLLIDQVLVKRESHGNPHANGEPRTSWNVALTDVACRICPKSGRRQATMGKKQLVSDYLMYTAGEENLLEGDMVQDQNGMIYEILFVRACRASSFYHHTEVDLHHRAGEEMP